MDNKNSNDIATLLADTVESVSCVTAAQQHALNDGEAVAWHLAAFRAPDAAGSIRSNSTPCLPAAFEAGGPAAWGRGERTLASLLCLKALRLPGMCLNCSARLGESNNIRKINHCSNYYEFLFNPS